MKFAALVGAFFFLWIPFVHADTLESEVTKKICEPGTIKKEARKFNPGGEASSLKKMVVEGNLCTNDKMIVNRSELGNAYEESTCICTTQQQFEQVGCAKGQKQPTVAITIPRDISGCQTDTVVVSKCATDLEKAYEAGCKRGMNVSTVRTDTDANISIATAGTPRNTPSLGLSTESGTLIKALTDTGVPPEKAQELAVSNRKGAFEYIEAMASNNTEKAKAAAEAIGINPDLATDQRALEAAKQAQKALADNPLESSPFYRSGATSFSDPDARSVGNLPRQCGQDGIAGNMMLAESGCNRAPTNAINPYVGGAHHYLCETWQADVAATGLSQYRDCTYRFDVEASSQVVNARYAQHAATYGDRCTSAGVSVTSCMYAIHVFGEGGFRNILAAQQQNPNAPASVLCGSAVSNGACSGNAGIFTNGGTVQGVFGELDRRLTGGSVVTSYSTNTGVSSPFSVGASVGDGRASTYNTGSPMAQASIFGNLNNGNVMGGFNGLNLGQLFQPQQQQQSPYQQQYPYQAPPIQQQASQQLPIRVMSPSPIVVPTTNPTTTPVTATTTTATTSVPSVQPLANLSIQPKLVAIGDPFVVSWTSAGMKSDFPCILSQSGKEIARGASGARQITVPFATSSEYLLTCVSAGGQGIQKKETVVIK